MDGGSTRSTLPQLEAVFVVGYSKSSESGQPHIKLSHIKKKIEMLTNFNEITANDNIGQ